MLFRNNQNETFTDVAASMNITGGFGDYFGTAWGDYNNDGAIDIFVACHYHIYRLYKNNNCQGNYLILKLRGQQSNQNAVGAKVNLWCNIGTLTRFVKAGEEENDFHSLDVEFGLDTCNIIDSFIVNWPSGHIQKLYNIFTNQIININENDTYYEDFFYENYRTFIEKSFKDKNLEVSSVLDLGCGTGRLLSILNYKYRVGIDRSKEMLDKCKDKNVKLIQGDMINFQSKDKFDLIL